MKEKSFVRHLDLENRVRVSFQAHQAKIKRFVIQYEILLEQEWQPVIRYDTAHGFAHADIYHPGKKTQKVLMHTVDYNEALTMAQEDIKQHWEEYRQHYIQEKNK